MTSEGSGRAGLPRRAAAIGLGLVLLMPAAFGKEKAGAHLKLVRKDGTVVEGELLAVKGRDLVLRTYPASEGVTEGIDGLAEVRILRKPRVLNGLGNGFLIGGLAGAGLGAMWGSSGHDHAEEWLYIGPRNAGEGALAGVVVCGGIGALIGTIGGALGGHDQAYRIQGSSPSYVNGVLNLLAQRCRRSS
jgi:hypothetical protein